MNLDFLLKFKCIECDNLQYKIGLCHEHYNINKCNDIINMLCNLTRNEINNYTTKITDKLINIYCTYNNLYSEIDEQNYLNCQFLIKSIVADKYTFLSNYDYTILSTISYDDIIDQYLNFNVDCLINLYKQYDNNFKTIEDIEEYFNNYDKTNKDIEKLMLCNYKLLNLNLIIQDYGENLIYLLYERKLLSNNKKLLYKILQYKNKKHKKYKIIEKNINKIINTPINNLNSYKLFRHILTNDITKHILILTCEHKIKINKRSAYFDIYAMIRTKNNMCLEAVIEIDEKQHFNTSILENKRDIIKDLYTFQIGA
jgi:hypothetical protein